MSRPIKKPNGKQLSAYISGELYEEFIKSIPPGKSKSDIIELAIKYYIENKDLVKEYEELLERYATLQEHCKSMGKSAPGPGVDLFIQNLKTHIREGLTWRQVLEAMGIKEPKEIVEYLRKYTYYPQGSKSVRFIRDINEYFLTDAGNAPSDVYFIFTKRIKR